MIFHKRYLLSWLALLLVGGAPASAQDAATQSKAPDRGPKNLGSVLVFAGTGWYRHPETAALSGWLARLGDDLGMQVDITETPKDLETILPRYKVLVLNNCTEVTQLLDAKQMLAVEQWHKQGGGKAMGKDHPICWINTLTNGRFFYTELGHDVRSLDTPFGRRRILGAIRWAARQDAVR